MGSEFETHVEDLRAGAADLNAQVDGMMGSMSDEVTRVVSSLEEQIVGKAVDKAVGMCVRVQVCTCVCVCV